MSNLAPTTTAEECGNHVAPSTLQELPGRLSDLGGLAIRRLLPRSQRRLVGPWCFLDAFGPLSFASGKPMDVAPHPHVGLQTVSWLLEGEVLHHDSLGLVGTARPGVVSVMTAGRGIAHSEQTPTPNSGTLRGVQLWVALPASARETDPGFASHPVPAVELEGGRASVFIGRLADARSPAPSFSPIVGAELAVAAGARLVLPLEREFEHALVPLSGACRLGDQTLAPDTLYYLGCGRRELALAADADRGQALLIGGAPLGESVLMWWNFVARTTDEIVAAREDWEAGRRFGEVAAYAGPRIPAPPFRARPVPR